MLAVFFILIVLISIGITIFTVVIYLKITRSWILETENWTPAHFNLRYDFFSIEMIDKTLISAWHIKVNNPKAVMIVSHGQSNSKSMILPYIEQFAYLGYDIIIYDLRSHGKSTKNRCTIGALESNDLSQVISYTIANISKKLPIVLWGFSLGATVSLIVAGKFPAVKAVIAQSPFVSIHGVISWYLWKFWNCPPWPFTSLVMLLMKIKIKIKPKSIDIKTVAKQLSNKSILLLGADNDLQVPTFWLDEIQNLLGINCKKIIGPYGHLELAAVCTNKEKSPDFKFVDDFISETITEKNKC